MISFQLWEITGSLPFDLAFSLVSYFALAGMIIKTIKSVIYGRVW